MTEVEKKKKKYKKEKSTLTTEGWFERREGYEKGAKMSASFFFCSPFLLCGLAVINPTRMVYVRMYSSCHNARVFRQDH